MERSNLILLLALISILALTATILFAQNDPHSFRLRPTQPRAAHGLLLTLSRDQLPGMADTTALKRCLDRNPPAACLLLTMVLKNEGQETVLTISTSCPALQGVYFDLLNASNGWEQFPSSEDPQDLPSCARNVAIVQVLAPGESVVRHLRLADIFVLRLDAAVFRKGNLVYENTGHSFLVGPGPHTIRAHWTIQGCTASDKLKQGTDINFLTAPSLCVAGTVPEKQFVDLQSNQLNLDDNPEQR